MKKKIDDLDNARAALAATRAAREVYLVACEAARVIHDDAREAYYATHDRDTYLADAQKIYDDAQRAALDVYAAALNAAMKLTRSLRKK